MSNYCYCGSPHCYRHRTRPRNWRRAGLARLALLLLATLAIALAITAFARAQEKAEKKDDLALTAAETQQIVKLEQSFNQAQSDDAQAKADSISLAISDKSGFEALGRRVQQIAVNLNNLRQQFNEWLQDVRSRNKCDTCIWDGQARKLVKPK